MRVKKIIAASILPLFLSSILLSQTLVELAQKERERRERLKGKRALVVTNADLAKLRKKPAVSVPQPGVEEEEDKETIVEEKSTPKKTEAPSVAQAATTEPEETISDLEEKWKRAKEYSDLLSLKMNALWQEFYSLDDMISRDSIQSEISETYLKLQKANEEEEKARKELDQKSLKQKK